MVQEIFPQNAVVAKYHKKVKVSNNQSEYKDKNCERKFKPIKQSPQSHVWSSSSRFLLPLLSALLRLLLSLPLLSGPSRHQISLGPALLPCIGRGRGEVPLDVAKQGGAQNG